MREDKEEYVVCAAIKYRSRLDRWLLTDGFVLTGHRHANIIHTMFLLTGYKTFSTDEQGFLTSLGRFVSRREAKIIALQQKQINETHKLLGEELDSSDLY